ncbi:MAG TPA: hypothetical protein VI522_02575 [Gammaproteobacteria bacterium]|nr:hypothetical protein [Gammaproteobacteria bacterium]
MDTNTDINVSKKDDGSSALKVESKTLQINQTDTNTDISVLNKNGSDSPTLKVEPKTLLTHFNTCMDRKQQFWQGKPRLQAAIEPWQTDIAASLAPKFT